MFEVLHSSEGTKIAANVKYVKTWHPLRVPAVESVKIEIEISCFGCIMSMSSSYNYSAGVRLGIIDLSFGFAAEEKYESIRSFTVWV